jgi:hypothetical protein
MREVTNITMFGDLEKTSWPEFKILILISLRLPLLIIIISNWNSN